MIVGRVRVELKDKSGALVVPSIDTKEKLLHEIAKLIPTLESRRNRIAQFEAQRIEYEKRMQSAASKPSKKEEKKKAAAAGKKKGK